MNLIDDCTGEMQCRVCGSVHIATRDNKGKYPPELCGAYMDVSQKISTNGSFLSTFLREKHSSLSCQSNSDLMQGMNAGFIHLAFFASSFTQLL